MAKSVGAAPMGADYLSLPPHLSGGNTAGSPSKGFPAPIGKTRTVQNLGNLSGQRASGTFKGDTTPQQQMSHAFENYGKSSTLKEGDLS